MKRSRGCCALIRRRSAWKREIALPVKGFGVALDDKRGLLYLTQGFNGSVAVVDICKNRLIATIPLMEEVVLSNVTSRRAFPARGWRF